VNIRSSIEIIGGPLRPLDPITMAPKKKAPQQETPAALTAPPPADPQPLTFFDMPQEIRQRILLAAVRNEESEADFARVCLVRVDYTTSLEQSFSSVCTLSNFEHFS
jgi:hypothetical protein